LTDQDGYRLSPQQRRLWALSSGSPEAVECIAIIHRSIRADQLIAAIKRVAAEHEILRTNYKTTPGIKLPLQVIRPALDPEFDADCASGHTITLENARACLRDRPTRRWEPASEPPLRVEIVALEGSEHLIRLSTVPYCLDSQGLVKLLQISLSHCRGAAPIGDVVQYADYSEWINEFLKTDDPEAGRAYWRRTTDFAALPPRLPLAGEPSDSEPRRWASSGIEIGGPLASAIDQLAQGCSCSRNSVLIAACALLVARHLETARICIGLSCSGQGEEDLAGALGPFARLLPVPLDLAAADDFRALIRMTETRRAEAEGWHECLEWLDDVTSRPYSISFEELVPQGHIDIDGFHVLELSFSPERASLHLVTSADSARCAIVYDALCFSKGAADELARQVGAVISVMTKVPGGCPLSVPLWNDCGPTGVASASSPAACPAATVLDRLDLVVRARPEHPAVVRDDALLTYRDLDEYSRNLSAAMRSKGVGPGESVALVLDRVPGAIAAALAVLRTGAAYVPIAISNPPERIADLVGRSKARVVLTDAADVERLRGCQTEIIDINRIDIRQPLGADECESVPPDAIAYVIFTSGSTGEPKGVEVSHASLLASTEMRRTVYPGEVHRLLLLASLSFDSSIAAIFWTLLDGGTLHLCSEEVARETRQLAGLVARERITHVQALPSLYHMLLEEDGRLESLRAVTVAGEVCPLNLPRLHYERLPSTLLVNEYGPTESTVWSTAHVCAKDNASGPLPSRVPIGRPAGHVTIQIVDTELRRLPVGIPGEILIGGLGLARGYLGEPALTAERFIPDPWSDICGARIYRSGDRGFWRPDGEIEFLGRVDDQLKIRGFRVEPGEIESVLRGLCGIQDACVVAHSDAGLQRLVAFVVMSSGRSLDRSGTMRRLESRLPEFMWPAEIVALPKFPVNPNGKVDRAALRDMRTDSRHGELFEPPVTAEQRTLAEIWRQVLGLDRVGIHDNFFELGGDSIKILRVCSKAAKCGLNFTVRQMLEHPTIAVLEQVIVTLPPGTAREILPFELVPQKDLDSLPPDVLDAYPMTMLQLAMIYHSERAPHSGIYHDVLACRVRVKFDAEVFRRCLQDAVGRHPVLRTSFDIASFSEPLQLVRNSAVSLLQIIDLRNIGRIEQTGRLAAYLTKDRMTPFDWSRGPLLRVAVHLCSDSECHIAWTSHHAILDGWSASCFVSELIQSYLFGIGEIETVRDFESPPLFSEYVRLERATLSATEDREFWRNYLMPVSDRGIVWARSPSVRAADPDVRPPVRIPLERSLSAKLAKLASETATSLRAVLLTSHCYAVCRRAAPGPCLTGVFTHGRPEQDNADRTLGLFLQVLPLRIDVVGGTWRQLIRQIAGQELLVFPHRRYPLAAINRAVGCAELFDTAFNYVNFHILADARRMPGLQVLDVSATGNNEFAWTTVCRREPNGELVVELHLDPGRICESDCFGIADGIRTSLEAMALSPDGDHQLGGHAIAAEHSAGIWQAGEGRAPENDIERRLVELCQHVIDADPIDVDENFFALGGDSLAALRLLALISREYGRNLPVEAFLESPSLSGLARQIEASWSRSSSRHSFQQPK
jgi:amino acid adenylation domain-containing protein